MVGWTDENGNELGKFVEESEIFLLPKKRRSLCYLLNARNLFLTMFVFSVLDIYFAAVKVNISLFLLFNSYES